MFAQSGSRSIDTSVQVVRGQMSKVWYVHVMGDRYYTVDYKEDRYGVDEIARGRNGYRIV